MSLINKMLQDLDARGSQAGSAMPADVRPAPGVQRRLPVKQIALASSVLVVGIAVAMFFWLKKPGQISAPAVLVAGPVVAPVPTVAALLAAPAPQPVAAQVATARAAPATPKIEQDPTALLGIAPSATAPTRVVRAPGPTVEIALNDSREVRVATKVRDAGNERIEGTPSGRSNAGSVRAQAPGAEVVSPRPLTGGRDMNPTQRSETHYRNALAALEEGRVAAAFEGLEQTLKINPRHDAARQSLVALLIEAGRNDEAMAQLEQGLAVDPAQPTLAMLLARMQIERGTSGVVTLLRTLPTASGNADYHAFLAGALQRESRHREAAEQYGAALRQNPDHGVWLMGLGISLQAEKRDREALAAFQRAKTSGTLTAPLLAFVERKVQQLTP